MSCWYSFGDVLPSMSKEQTKKLIHLPVWFGVSCASGSWNTHIHTTKMMYSLDAGDAANGARAHFVCTASIKHDTEENIRYYCRNECIFHKISLCLFRMQNRFVGIWKWIKCRLVYLAGKVKTFLTDVIYVKLMTNMVIRWLFYIIFVEF